MRMGGWESCKHPKFIFPGWLRRSCRRSQPGRGDLGAAPSERLAAPNPSTRIARKRLDVQIVTDHQVIVTNVSFHKRDHRGMLVMSDAPADQCSRNQRSHILLDNTPHNQLKHRSISIARFANSAFASQEPVRCYTARAGASFRFSAAQHPHGPGILPGPLSLAGAEGPPDLPKTNISPDHWQCSQVVLVPKPSST